MARKKHSADDIQRAISLIGEGAEIPKRLQRYKNWGDQYLSGKKRPTKKMVDKLLLDFARDFKVWIIQTAIEHSDITTLANLASEILDRYEDKPKTSMELDEDGAGVGGIVMLPEQKHMEIKDGESKDNLESPSRPTDGVSE